MAQAWRYLGQCLLLAAVYVAAGRFGLLFPETQENTSLVWPPTGIALAAVLLFGARVWPGLVVGAFLVNVMTSAPLAVALATAVGNPLEALVGAYLLRRCVAFHHAMDRVRDVIGFVILAALLSTTLSSTVGVAAVYLTDAHRGASFGRLWLHWWLGDAMGDLVVAPFCLVWLSKPFPLGRAGNLSDRTGPHRYAVEAVVWFLGIAAIAYLSFGGWIDDVLVSAPVAFTLFPLLIWMALRFGQHGTTSGTLLVVSIAIAGTLQGHGPLSRGTREESLVYLHIFMAVASVSGMLLSAAIAERRHAEAGLEESERRFHALCETSPIGIFQTDAEGNCLYANARALEVTGLTMDQAMGFNWVPFIHTDDRERVVHNWTAATREGRDFNEECRFIGPAGKVLWVRAHARTLPMIDGRIPGYVGTVEDISGQKRLESRLQHYAQRLRTLSRRLLDVQEQERRHLARELHDEIGQMLTGLHFTLEAASRDLSDDSARTLHTAQNMVKDLTTRIRDLSLRLRPTMLDDLGLMPALLWHFERFTASTQVRVRFEHNLAETRLPPALETAAYRIVQESLTNVARHAGVQEVTVRLWVDQDALHLQVADKGAGFDPKAVFIGSHTSGLAGMFERVDLLDGDLTIQSAPGTGTHLSAVLPMPNGTTRTSEKSSGAEQKSEIRMSKSEITGNQTKAENPKQ